MREFTSRLVAIDDGRAVVRRSVDRFRDRMSEEQLERHVVAHPDLLGEEVLILGRQLAEFMEDRDRLGVLAIDRDGEIGDRRVEG